MSSREHYGALVLLDINSHILPQMSNEKSRQCMLKFHSIMYVSNRYLNFFEIKNVFVNNNSSRHLVMNTIPFIVKARTRKIHVVSNYGLKTHPFVCKKCL